MENPDLEELLRDLADYLEDHADAEYSTDSPSPRPNEAMRLLTRVRELLP